MSTALAKAMKGEAVTDRQAKSALEEAVGKLSSLKKQAQNAKEQLTGAVDNATGVVVHTVETQTTIFGFSMIEGYRGGPDRMQLGKVDVRAPLGLAGMGYGLMGCFMDLPGSNHALAVANGVTGSWLASLGAQAGLALAEKRGAIQPAPAPVSAPVMQGMNMGADVRQVVLTPEPSAEGDFDFGRQRRGGGRRGRSGGQSQGGQGRGGRGGRGGKSGQRGSDGLTFEERKERDGGQGRAMVMARGRGGGGGGGGRRQGGGGRNRFRQGPMNQSEEEQAA